MTNGCIIIPHVVEDSSIDPLDGLVEVCILKHNAGRLSPKLQRDTLQICLGRRAKDPLSDRRAASEGDFVDIGVLGEASTCFVAKASHDVDDAGGEACLVDQLG